MAYGPVQSVFWGFSSPWSLSSGHWSYFIIGCSNRCFGRGGLKMHKISKCEVGSHATSLFWCLQGQELRVHRRGHISSRMRRCWTSSQAAFVPSELCLLKAPNALWPSGEFPCPVLLTLLPRGNLARCVSEALCCSWMSLSLPDCRICVTISSELDPCDILESSLTLWCWHLILDLGLRFTLIPSELSLLCVTHLAHRGL